MKGTALKPGQTGFTLLEVLIATVLLAIMLTLLLGSIRMGVGSWEKGESISEGVSRLLVVQNFLRTHITATLPLAESLPGADPESEPPLMFQGGSNWLEFVGTLPPQVRGGLYKFRLYLAGNGDHRDLKLSISPLSANGATTAATAAAAPDPIEDVIVLENLESLKITYLSKTGNPDEGPRWAEMWRATFMPALVRLDIVPFDENPWPPLLIEPRVETRR